MTSRNDRPIDIAAYDPRWPGRFASERALIVSACGADAFARIEHVGSTAVPGLAAKPIVDIMAGVRSLVKARRIVGPLATAGYAYVPEHEAETPERLYFRKDLDGARAVHLHVVVFGGEWWRNHMLFRNYLRAHPDATGAYEALKRDLAAQFGTDREGYTEAKTDFIAAIVDIALGACHDE